MEKSHHRRFKTETSGDEYASPTVGALITNGFTTGGDGPSHHHRLKSNAPQTVAEPINYWKGLFLEKKMIDFFSEMMSTMDRC